MPKDILIVDDESEFRDLLKACFEQKGCRVATAENAQSALRQLRQLPADIVLLDLRLPDRSGLELLSQIKQELPGLRIVVVSGLDDQQTIREALERGASTYLTKPFDFADCFYAAMGIDTIDLATAKIETEALACLPLAIAQQYDVMPVRIREGVLEVAVSNPLDPRLLEDVPLAVGCAIKPLAVIGGEIGEAMRRAYGAKSTPRAVPVAPVKERGKTARAPKPVLAPLTTAAAPEEAAGLIEVVNRLILHACANRASDLHLGVDANGPWVQERIDGVLYDVPADAALAGLYPGLVLRLKVMAKLNLSEHRLPQEGRIWFTQADKPLDLRLSILPTPHGEHVVLRLLEPSQVPPLAALGWSETQLPQVQALLARPSGLLLVSGPTGAGLSTTLYAALAALPAERSRVVTVEDPIEHELPRATQVQVQPKIGLTFAAGLRAALQHDPNVILIGELRDQDTAQLAVRAALSGHLVLAGVHTLDAASGITRLLDFGVEPFLLCSTLLGIVSQRLVRVLCRECRHAMQVDPATLATMGITAAGQSGPLKMWRARTCPACRESGYHGRTGVFEVLAVDHHIRSLMIKRASGIQVRQSAMAQGMQTLWQSGWQKLAAGTTSLEELARVIPRELR